MCANESAAQQLSALRKLIAQAEDSFEVSSAPTVDVATPMLRHALRLGAKGIRITPGRPRSHVEYLLQSRWQGVLTVSRDICRHVTTWLKLLTNTIDITIKGVPQEGVIVLAESPADICFLLKTTPAEHGESVSIRIERGIPPRV